MKREFHIGPGAASLILIIVILSLSVLSVLALTNARSDERLTVRSAAVTEALAKLNADAERSLADLDGVLAQARATAKDDAEYLSAVQKNLPSGMTLTENTVSWTAADDEDRTLYCSVEILPLAGQERFAWKEHRLSSSFSEMELEETWN